ncbi:hypothetical protein M0805_004297 [Coniferiporia weirii]|nr:hypothetical protein M0805_004297 [Coniferiporia weirii]
MKFDTVYPADSVEFCPAPGFEDIFVCGTYKLIESTVQHPDSESDTPTPGSSSSPRRIGKCIVFELSGEQGDSAMNVLQELEMPAILDMKWSPSNPILAIADSEGHLSIQRLTSQKSLQEIQNIQCRPSDTLCLSLDWSNRRNSSNLGSISVSSSDGFLSVWKPDSSGTFCEALSWLAHDFEAWITAWDYWNTNTVYSGGDDLKFKGWDVRQGTLSPTFTNKRFDAGVTSIQCHPHLENIVAVGSYDATVRIFDMRKPQVPITQARVGGGAWRVKWHPHEARHMDLLVACMHDGFKIVRFSSAPFGVDALDTNDDGGWQVIKRYDEHKNLAYGADWAYGRSANEAGTLIASCSFYDHVLHTWEG